MLEMKHFKFITPSNPLLNLSIKLRLLVQQFFVLTSKLVNILKSAHHYTHKVGKNQRKHQMQQAGQDNSQTDKCAVLEFLFRIVLKVSIVEIYKECCKTVKHDETGYQKVGKSGADLKE